VGRCMYWINVLSLLYDKKSYKIVYEFEVAGWPMLLPTQLGYIKVELLLFSLMCSLYEMLKWEGVVLLHHCIPGLICKCHTLVKAVSFYRNLSGLLSGDCMCQGHISTNNNMFLAMLMILITIKFR
jgi:hypothetical protein